MAGSLVTIEQLEAMINPSPSPSPSPLRGEGSESREFEAIMQKAAESRKPKQLNKRDARHQMLGMMKMALFFAGETDNPAALRDELVVPTDLFVKRVDELETQIAEQQRMIERYEKALANVADVLLVHTADFDPIPDAPVKPLEKLKLPDLRKWSVAALESMRWVMQRAENELDPAHEVVIARGPRD